MFNIFKSKSVELTAMSWRHDVINWSPIIRSSEHTPKWFRDLPSDYPVDELHSASTMRFCIGVTDLFGKGFIVPMWSDFNIIIGEIGTNYYRFQYADDLSKAHEHNPLQRGSFANEHEYQHMKLLTPWRMQCNADIDFLVMPVPWHMDNPSNHIVLPGILNFSEVSACNINLLFKRNTVPTQYSLKMREPLCQLIPLTDKKIALKIKHITENEMLNLRNFQGTNKFIGDAVLKRRLRKIRSVGCPMDIFKGNKDENS